MACPLSIPAETSWMANHEDALNSVILNCRANWRPCLTNPAQSSLHDIPRKDRRRPFGAGQTVEPPTQNIAIGLTGDPVALGSANGVTVNMNSQRLREAVASLNASRSARSSTWIPRIAWTKL
jgi:hypothetical protein